MTLIRVLYSLCQISRILTTLTGICSVASNIAMHSEQLSQFLINTLISTFSVLPHSWAASSSLIKR